MATATKAAPAKAAKPRTLKTCGCAALGTGCKVQVNRNFAQGHDARAKSILLKAHRAGEKVATGESALAFAKANLPSAVASLEKPAPAKKAKAAKATKATKSAKAPRKTAAQALAEADAKK